MLTVGQDLYQLTQRDFQTLPLDPFYRQDAPTQAGSATVTSLITIPRDRALYLAGFSVILVAAAAETWQQFQITAFFNDNTSQVILYDGRTEVVGLALAGYAVAINKTLNLLLPPNISTIQAIAQKSAAVQPAAMNLNFHGYKIPPGGIGRV